MISDEQILNQRISLIGFFETIESWWSGADIIYFIDDVLNFAPTREQVCLIFARYWYSKNIDQFT